MKTIFFLCYFFIYQIGCLGKRIKYEWLKKHRAKEDYEGYLFKILNAWGNSMAKSAGINIEVIGKENIPQEACLFVSNHQSDFDIPVLVAALNKPIGFIAKKELEKIPFVTYWMRQIHSVFMDRDNVREAIKSINEGIDNLKNGYSMVIFPEGTRSKCDQVGEFKKGSLRLGIKADVPMVPVTVSGTFKAFEANNNRVKSANVKIIISKPIYPQDLSKEEQNNLAETLREVIVANI